MSLPRTGSITKMSGPYFSRSQIIIFLVWALVNGFFLYKNGIVTSGEAEKYIYQANVFNQTGGLTTSNYWFYFTQIFLISVCLKFHLGFAFAVIVQLLLNLVATFSFYKILLFVCNDKRVVLLGVLLLVFNQPYQEFNSFLQTESIFFSLTLIFAYYLIHTEKLSFKRISGIILWMLLISITRPTGFLFVLPVFLYLWFAFFKDMNVFKKTCLALGIGGLFLYFLNEALRSGGGLDFILPFKQEMIICGVPSIHDPNTPKEMSEENSLYGLFYYLLHHFGQVIRLAWARTLAFFGLYRNYYSRAHNAYLISYFYLLQLLSLCGIFCWPKTRPASGAYFFSIILITWLTVTLTCDDWHNRFYLSISPYIIVFSMSFVAFLLNRKRIL